LIHVFLLAWKNYCLYPEGHSASNKALSNLEKIFDDYFSDHDDLQLVIERNRLLYESEVLHEVSPDSPAEDIIFLLYRDGMQWIEFRHGVTIEELGYFFKIVSNYRVLVEETEGDIITGLFDGDLPHIKFKALDTSWQDFPLMDFSELNTSLTVAEDFPYQMKTDEAHVLKGPAPREVLTKSIADPSVSETLWEISKAEHEKLHKMVLEEEIWDNPEDVFDVLLVILRSQTDRHNFSSVLDFTLEEVVETIEQEEFGLLVYLFQSLQQLLYRDESEEMSWVRPLVDRFFQDLSRPETFDLIASKLLRFNDNDSKDVLALRQALLYFSPEIIISMGPVLTRTQSHVVQNMILGVIEYLSLKDIGPLEKILDSPDAGLGEKLLPILKGFKGARSSNLFLKMTEHPSEKLREEGARVLLSRDKSFTQKLFSLIDDPSEKVRKVILSGIGKHKSSILENMLIKYIKEHPDQKDSDHILGCYLALGKCGSNNATPFLKRILLSKGWNHFKGFGKSVHREGAATALALLNSWESQDILMEASKSKYKIIREAFRKAMITIFKSGENVND
jgi:hypothetical protein